ncbi:signal peptidase II [Aestuariimicrobium sp. Y1814]|uniref:signal peptidase II n=1 Tax=Aestuariimicrobium sp. Y1814 TaxID=3418742 RepID=UPI003DA6FF46
MRRGPIVAVLVGVFLVGYALDQVTKALAVEHLDPANPPTFLGGWLSLKLIRNPGAAFSMGSGFTEVLSVLAIVALLFCAIYLAPRVTKVSHAAVLGMGMAGIAGNLTDRLLRAPGPLRGHVIDFFAVPRFAIFNVADIFLTSAAILVVLWTLVESRREAAREKAATEAAGDS